MFSRLDFRRSLVLSMFFSLVGGGGGSRVVIAPKREGAEGSIQGRTQRSPGGWSLNVTWYRVFEIQWICQTSWGNED